MAWSCQHGYYVPWSMPMNEWTTVTKCFSHLITKKRSLRFMHAWLCARHKLHIIIIIVGTSIHWIISSYMHIHTHTRYTCVHKRIQTLYQTGPNLSSLSTQLTALRSSFCEVCRRIRAHSTLPLTAAHNQWVTSNSWLRGTAVERRSLAGELSVLHSNCSWWVTTYLGKPSAIGQPTRPTQPFIPSGSIDE